MTSKLHNIQSERTTHGGSYTEPPVSSESLAVRRKVKLRSVLIIPFVLQIFMAVGLTGYFFFT